MALLITVLTKIISTGIDENHIDECSDVQKGSRKKGVTNQNFYEDQERATHIQQDKSIIARIAQEQIGESTIQGHQEAHEKSRLNVNPIFSENATVLKAMSLPKLGKKAESLSVKELKTELGKRGQPIDGNKKG
jgi:hypothetical protein